MADVDRLVALDRQTGLLSLVMWGSTGVCLDALPPGPCVKHHRRVGKMSVAQARRSSVLDRLLCMHDTPAVTAAGGKHLAPFSAALRVGAQISALECLQAWLGLLLSKCGPFASLPGTSRQLVGLMSLGRCSCSHTAATALQQHLVQAKNPFGLPASHPVPPPPPPRVQCCACLCCGRRSATPATCAGVRPPWQPCGSPSYDACMAMPFQYSTRVVNALAAVLATGRFASLLNLYTILNGVFFSHSCASVVRATCPAVACPAVHRVAGGRRLLRCA